MLRCTSEAARAIDLPRLAEVEREMHVEFPESYRQFLLANNGGRPSPSNFTVVENGELVWMSVHFFHGIDDEVESCDLLWVYQTFRRRLPMGVFSVACDENGNQFCLDLRTSRDGPVLFWDHELEHRVPSKALSAVVAANFESWMAQLCESSS